MTMRTEDEIREMLKIQQEIKTFGNPMVVALEWVLETAPKGEKA